MSFLGLHLADWLVLILYFWAMIWIGRKTASGVHGQNDFFLAGRKLGRLYQFFLNFGNATDASGAVRTSSLVYNQGVGGVWLTFQTLFMTPYLWFLMPWFRRARVTTMADLFTERFGGRSLGVLYAVVGIIINTVVTGGGYLVTYKVLEVFIVKPESAYTQEDARKVAQFQEFSRLNEAYREGRLEPAQAENFQYLKRLHERKEIASYVSYAEPLPVYLIFTAVVGVYVILGGMKAAALTDAFQGILIVLFSVMLIPFGLWKLEGLQAFHERIPERMMQLFGSGGASEIAWYSIAAILLVSMVQIHGLSGNMAIAGSARDEAAAGLGAVSAGFTKRFMIMAWCFCGLLAFALFGPGLSDPDAVWGSLCRSLLGPGFFGLMLVGLLAGEMAGASAQSLTSSALFVKNIYLVIWPHKSERAGLFMGRILIAVSLIAAIGIALLFDDLIAFAKMHLTLNVAFGAAVLVLFKWRRITGSAMMATVLISLFIIVIVPFAVPAIPPLSTLGALQATTREIRETRTVPAAAGDVAAGRAARIGEPVEKARIIPPKPIFFDTTVTLEPGNPQSPRKGQGRFYCELYILFLLGLDLTAMLPAQLLALTYVFDSVFPFLLLFLFSFLTREKDPRRAERFYVKMRTPVDADPEKDAETLRDNLNNPALTEAAKLFPLSSWEFQKWTGKDTKAFAACCLIAISILGIFAFLLNLGRN